MDGYIGNTFFIKN